MKLRQLPIYFFIIGAVFKALLLYLFSFDQTALTYKLTILYDPIGMLAARFLTSLVFNKGIAPAGEVNFFNIALITSFAIECAVLGFLIQIAIKKIKN